jgi:chromosome segregation ATPase
MLLDTQQNISVNQTSTAKPIDTGVDKLLRIVARSKRIELSAVAKELGVPEPLVQEWARFLDEEKLIKIEYTLSRTYLVENVLTKAEVATKQKSYELKKDAFIRKVDIILNQLSSEQDAIAELKKQYNRLESVLGNDFGDLKDDVELLHHFEDLKKCVDDEISQQHKSYEASLREIHTRLALEEERYRQVLDSINAESEKLRVERTNVADIRNQELELVKRIDELNAIVKTLSEKLSLQSADLSQHDKRLQKLRDLAERLRNEIAEQRKKDLVPFEKLSRDQEGRILRIQNEMIEKIKSRYDKMKAYEGESAEAVKQLSGFFERRKRAGEVIAELNKSEESMRAELVDLILKAKTFDLAVKDSDMNSHIKDLESKFKQFDSKKNAFAAEIAELKTVLDVPASSAVDTAKKT